jgi:hypothetical protein
MGFSGQPDQRFRKPTERAHGTVRHDPSDAEADRGGRKDGANEPTS